MAYELTRIVHFGGIFVVAATVLIHYIAFAPTISREDARNLYKVDIAFWAASCITLIAGLVLWLLVGKPAEFYTANSLFHTKVALFLGLLICSIPPSKFLRQEGRHEVGEDDANIKMETPTMSRSLVRGKFLTIAVILICAFLIARGVGL